MAAPDHHKILIEGFHAIVDKNGLGWAVLDSKSEQLVTSAIATSINRKLGRRIAHVEFSTRIDLAILQTPIRHRERRCLDPGSVAVEMQYEAKIGHSFDFAPAQSTHEKYLGADLNRDMEGMSYGRGAGLFFVSDARDANRHLKYFRGHVARIDAVAATLCKHVVRGHLAAHETIDCGVCDGTDVRLHMFVFDPKASPIHAS